MNSLTTENRNLLMLEIPTFAANQQPVTVVGDIILVAKNGTMSCWNPQKTHPKFPNAQTPNVLSILGGCLICNHLQSRFIMLLFESTFVVG